MAAVEFSQWLSNRLTDLDIDPEVYSSYISSILEEEYENDDEIKESLNDILASFLEDSSEISNEIFSKWNLLNKNNSNGNTEKANKITTLTINDYVAAHTVKLAEKNKVEELSEDDKAAKLAAKKALLAKYSEVEDDFVEEGPEDNKMDTKKSGPAPNVDSALNMFQNLNVSSVVDAEKKIREKQKEDATKKKERDKLDKERLKAKKDERKEKEKKRTQKKERGRMT